MHPFSRSVLAIAVSTALAGSAAFAEALPPRAANTYLTQADAAARSARIANVDYVLDFALTGKETFSGTTTLTFDLSDTGAPLTIDLDKATIGKLVVNGKAVAPQYNQFFITVQPQDLVKGRNTVMVSYQRLHSTNGEGLHRMVDPVDGKVYTYSQFEPAAAHQMFALFDQPDLKATYQLTVTAPADWQVVSMMRESGVQADPAGKRWTFPKSKKLSAYNFSLHAGPYKVWEDSSGKYPMRLFARQSVATQVSPADWFKYTKQGLAFFDEYFGVPYQFEKYDQLLVPDFLYGAMENAGAVTFAEARLPVQGGDERGPAREPGRGDHARDGAPVVRRPGDDEVVERRLAQRELRVLHGHAGDRRSDRIQERLAGLLLRRQAGRLHRRPVACRPTRSKCRCRRPRMRSTTSTRSPTARARRR